MENLVLIFFYLCRKKTTSPISFESLWPPYEYIRFFGVQKLCQVSGSAYLQEPLSLGNIILHRKSVSIGITSSLRQFVLLHTLLHTSIDHLSNPIYCMEQPRGAVLENYSVKTDLTPAEKGSPLYVFLTTIN